MVRLQENKHRWFITIPKEIVQFKKWKKFQELLLVMDYEGNVQIKEVNNPPVNYHHLSKVASLRLREGEINVS